MIRPTRRVRGIGVGFLGVVALVGLASREPGASAASGDDQGRVDGDRWAKRNIELIRKELAVPPRDDQNREQLTVLIFSVYDNPLLLRDPYAAEVANLAEAYLPHAGANTDLIQAIIALYRGPEAERRRMNRDDISAALTPDRRPDQVPDRPDPGSIAARFRRLPADQRAAREPAMIAEMEAAARDSGNWGRLGLAYLQLAHDADADASGDRGRADRYGTRLLAILREHPGFQNPAQGNAAAVSPTSLAGFFSETTRRAQWDAFLASRPEAVRADLAIGEVGSLALKGDFDAARAVIDRQIRPIRLDAATRLEAATRGEIILPPARPRGPGVPDPPPEEGRLQQVQELIALGQATRGEVESAGRMLIALQRDDASHPAGEGRLVSFEWARLAMRAAKADHPDAARLGFDHANDMLRFDDLLTPDQLDEKIRLVREAVGLGAFDTANAMYQTTTNPGAWIRLDLARVYRRRGETVKAAALLNEGIALATPKEATGGSTLAGIAVELQGMGQPDRAEQVLLDSLSRIHGEDFGFGGTSNVVEAAIAMNRVDLLDRLFDQGDDDARLLLCVVVSWRSMESETPPGKP